ncbi:uncharacterized protein LOC131858615 [Cryptomeria japonica]|uniref:uncharacterized protein LOC131858615 n=1 Tax=Cryptomeria japonica TaxID=3369 RepID=UPI0027DA61C9|nr:uncharacterized protein LOC131858615 [Cryptomeria japonica]
MGDREEEEEVPLRVTNIELAKIVREQAAKNKKMEAEIEKLKREKSKKKQSEVISDSDEEDQEEERSMEEPSRGMSERQFIDALGKLSRKDTKVDLPMFPGKMNPEECLDWIEAMENYFECEEVSKNQKVRIGKSRMKGAALSWWNFIQNERIEEDKQPISTWRKMVLEIKKQFVPEDYEVSLHKKLQNLKQKDMDVSTYTEEFHKMNLKAKVPENEKQKLARYLNGLKFSIQDELSLFNPETVHKCFQMALRIEEKQKRRHDASSSRGRGNQNFRGRGRFQNRDFFPKNYDSRSQEGSQGQVERNNTNQGRFRGRGNGRGRGGGRGSSMFTGRCFSCNQIGHQSFRCPEKMGNTAANQKERRIQLLNEEDCQSTSSYHTTSSKPAAPESGECLMFNRSLIMPVTQERPQRNNLFRTTCKVKGKVCKVIVDSGSSENLVSNEMVNKLGLERIPHPNPYRVFWLTKEQQILVKEQCWVEFKIGEYHDQVLCEIVDMDACHLLLGRPWQHDTNSQHDGKKNVIYLTKNGEMFTMTPLIDDCKEKVISSSVMLIGEKEFLANLKEEKVPCFAVVLKPKEVNPKKDKGQQPLRKVGPKEVEGMLEMFQDVIANEEKDALPPKREISHCIDLIPGSTLPNQAAYKLTPKQNEEVARQIQDLLDRGLIRRSISP